MCTQMFQLHGVANAHKLEWQENLASCSGTLARSRYHGKQEALACACCLGWDFTWQAPGTPTDAGLSQVQVPLNCQVSTPLDGNRMAAARKGSLGLSTSGVRFSIQDH